MAGGIGAARRPAPDCRGLLYALRRAMGRMSRGCGGTWAADLAGLPDPLRAAASLGARGGAALVLPVLPLARALRRAAGGRVFGDADRAGAAGRRAGAAAARQQR